LLFQRWLAASLRQKLHMEVLNLPPRTPLTKSESISQVLDVSVRA
jgi:hypothetical protein